MTLLASSENVLQTIPPQPRSYDRAITLPLVPGGPDPSRNGLSNFMPFTVIDRSVTAPPRGFAKVGRIAHAGSRVQARSRGLVEDWGCLPPRAAYGGVRAGSFANGDGGFWKGNVSWASQRRTSCGTGPGSARRGRSTCIP